MKTALIIEDNENNMELITFILEANGYTTARAENGLSGLKMVREINPDLIILDIQLPDIDGTIVLEEIRNTAINPLVPVIAMTSFAMAGDREKLMAAGCTGYIEKPIDPDRVVTQIETILEEYA